MAELDVKRLPVATVIEEECENCKAKLSRDLQEWPLEYPDLDVETVTFWCEDCDHETSVDYKLNITFERIDNG